MQEERPGMLFGFFVRAFLGLAVIVLVNYILDAGGASISVGINPFSFLTSGIFGIPGVALLYGIVLYQSL